MTKPDNERTPRIDSAGEAVRIAREQAGMTLAEVAERLGWDKSRLSRYETDSVALSAETIIEIAGALRIHPEQLLFECLKLKFPRLADTGTQLGALFAEMLEFLSKSRPKSATHFPRHKN